MSFNVISLNVVHTKFTRGDDDRQEQLGSFIRYLDSCCLTQNNMSWKFRVFITSLCSPISFAMELDGFKISMLMLIDKNRSGFALSLLKHRVVFMYCYSWNEVLKSDAWYDYRSINMAIHYYTRLQLISKISRNIWSYKIKKDW